MVGAAKGLVELLVTLEERVDDGLFRVGILHPRERSIELSLETNGDGLTNGQSASLHAKRARLLQDLGAKVCNA